MNLFNVIAKPKIPRSTFDLSHEKKLTGKMGYLYPVLCQEVVPGDRFDISTESMIRLAPMVSPVMHRVDSYIHYFYVPNRLLWEYWEGYITGQNKIDLPNRTFAASDLDEGELLDYFGLPTHDFSPATLKVNTLPLRAYKLIWNEYYRDENLSSELDITDDTSFRDLLKRAWEKDYFTSALPWAQKGGTVDMTITSTPTYLQPALMTDQTSTITPAIGNVKLGTQVGTYSREIEDSSNNDLAIQNIDSIEGNIDINELRTAHRLQRWMERNARAGTRYVEHLLAHWGVKSSDARLDRPEYIGGGKSPVVISEVLNTFGSDDANAHPQGSMSGHGLNVGATNQASKFCEEHGYIIGLMSVLPKTGYYQGVPRMFTRLSHMDFYYPEFARLGEQEVKNKEVYMSTVANDNEATFGYQSRYAEYKYQSSMVHGEFRTSLEHWHLGRKFIAAPTLNDAFVESKPDDRIFIVQDGTDQLWINLYHKITANRPMPYFNDPTL